MQPNIAWSDRPAATPPGTRLDLIRCKTGSLPPYIVLSDRQLGAEIHWYNGRSFPHLKNGCPACDAKRPAVWKGFLAVWNPKTRAVGILEITSRCTEALDAHYLAYGTLRSAVITISRKGTKDKGPLSVEIVNSTYATNEIPATPDVRAALTAMWQAARVDAHIDLTPPRPVLEPAMTNDELARRHPERFARQDLEPRLAAADADAENPDADPAQPTTPQPRRNGART